MILSWYHKAWEIKRYINSLIEDTLRNPTEGIGKPEPLKHELTGAWSRRIDQEHRLVYMFTETTVTILSCKTHYQ